MIKREFEGSRELKRETHQTELAIVGGGLSGVCTAITAARRGVKVVLVQDRPVLGGNSSSEVRLWILGATSHLGNNNRWSREGGVIDEILVENTYSNKEGNPLLFDAILLDKVKAEPNITLLLNTAVYEVHKKNDDTINSIKGFCSQNSTEYIVYAPLFCDASGDGIVGFLSGAAFRMGAEKKEEFGEKFAPTEEYGELLGHSMYFYTKDTGRPVKYKAPAFALDVAKEVPKFRKFNAKEHGCQLWWLEHGGRMDTIHDTEQIKWDLWKVIYGAWDYVKNSGNFPEADTMTLEWVGTIPGKRESRRFEGDYMLRQQDIVEQCEHEDAVAYGGWSIDLHPADGVFSEKPGCNQWHAKGIYQIPYRCLYSKNIKNLFLGGRLISATHVAFASTRVMATAAHIGQAIGMAAYIAKEKQYLYPRDILTEGFVPELQQELLKSGQHIPKLALQDEGDLVQHAKLNASSNFELETLKADFALPIDTAVAQMLPLEAGKVPDITIEADVTEDTELRVELRMSSRTGNYTPDVTLETKCILLEKGRRTIKLSFSATMPERAYAFVTFLENTAVSLYRTNTRVTGVLTAFNLINKAVSNFGKQTPPEDIGMEAFEFWCPQRRPDGHNLALQVEPALRSFGVEQIKTGVYRPTTAPNAWVASLEDAAPQLKINWDEPQEIRQIDLFFDTDYDHPMESVLMGHPEDVMPFCVRNYKIVDDQGHIVFEKEDNYQSMNRIELEQPVITSALTIVVDRPSENVPASLFSVRCYN
ncbi:FAD-dependent oxidoreductase [Sphingobacterium corticibacterium]|uniref:FAD-dependent oxidoreductase n=1 Tax=Sphingobacterium corticibacterium TaxID=2484746 RepID=A0A4V2DBN0_9SPHI|nr:FAD-dependent oxidoreductase [Sphingobacterium corticibacterium]RZF58558.1 FAD-dependent oxidoreductase [Sphingobacterium corticibacterium]